MTPDIRKERETALYEAALRLIAKGVNPAAMKVQQDAIPVVRRKSLGCKRERPYPVHGAVCDRHPHLFTQSGQGSRGFFRQFSNPFFPFLSRARMRVPPRQWFVPDQCLKLGTDGLRHRNSAFRYVFGVNAAHADGAKQYGDSQHPFHGSLFSV